jgi:hypothetical protein
MRRGDLLRILLTLAAATVLLPLGTHSILAQEGAPTAEPMLPSGSALDGPGDVGLSHSGSR